MNDVRIEKITLKINPQIVKKIHMRALDGFDFFSGISGDEIGLNT